MELALTPDIKIRVKCLKEKSINKGGLKPVIEVCGGLFEGTITELVRMKYGVKCPKCGHELSQGRKFSVSGDQIQVIGEFLRVVSGPGKGFEVVLVKEEVPDV